MSKLNISLRALFVKAVVRDWSEDELMLLFPDNTIGEVKAEMLEVYNTDISATTLEQKYREYLDGMTITMSVHMN